MSVFDGVRRVLFVHAHPDDETLATGALIVELVTRGIECVVLTATRGEQGGIVEGRFEGLAGEAFVERREVELAGALAELGAGKPMFLGDPPARAEGLPPRRYVDSGMEWVRPGLAGPADDAGPDSLTAADKDEAIADLVVGIKAIAPDLVITYDDAGGYGHPDHVACHHLTRAAYAEAGVPFAEVLSDPEASGEWLDLQEHLPTVAAALEHHQTQVTVDVPDVIHSGGQREPIQLRIGVKEV
ncbi:PIG-L family deacetylase [Ammonicoccus fulvus]|uniref:PIG-L family deacetylase n=1 Tax=Ammonicoccus fulvus TaxID=3138240 RepID=A0ABZ3FKD8_9ACTN